MTTGTPSRVRWTSSSRASTPNATACANDSSVFSGACAEFPRWAITSWPSRSVSTFMSEAPASGGRLLRDARARRHQRRAIRLNQHARQRRAVELGENLLRPHDELTLLRDPEPARCALGFDGDDPTIEFACRHRYAFLAFD